MKTVEEIKITDFRNLLDESILERGWYYFKNGWVVSLKKTKGNFYEAVVRGADENLVVFQREKDALREYFCTCHYKFGKPCRHLSAVLYWLEEKEKPEYFFQDTHKLKLQK